MGSFATWIEIELKDNFSSQLTKAGMQFRSFKGNLDEFATKGKIFDDVAMKLTIMSQSVQMVADSFAKIVDEPKKLAMDIEDSLATVNSVLTDDMAKNMEGFSITISEALKLVGDEASKFAKSHGVSSKSFIDTNYLMVGAGLNTQQSIFATSQSMLLAKATMGTATEAANLLANIYNNMGDKLKNPQDEFTRLSDILARTQGVFKIKDLNQLNEGLKYGIPTANAFGISIEQLNAVIGQLNNSGLEGSMAGTGFSAMLSQMSKASAEVGFDIIVNEKGDMNIIKTIGSMKSKYEELSKTLGNQKTADLFNKSFGQEAFKSVSNLMTQFDSLQENFKAVQDASVNSGATMDAYNKITDTTSYKMQKLQERKNELKIKMGELMKESNKMGLGFSSAILSMNEAFVNSPIGEKLTIIGMNAANVGKGFLSATSEGMQFAASGLTIISLMEKMGTVKNLLINGFSLLGTGFGFISKAIMGVIPAMTGWITTAWGAVVANWAFIGPILLGVAAVALLAGAVYLIIKNWGAVSKFLMSTWETVKSFFINLWNGIVGIFQKAWDFIWNGLLNNRFIQIALAVFMPIIGIPIMIIKHWGVISSFFVGLWNGIVTGAKNIWNGITTFFVGLWNGIVATFQKAWNFIWNGLLNNKFIQIALAIFMPFIGLPVMIIKNWDKIISFFKSIPSFFKGIWDKTVDGVDKSFKKMTNFFKGLPEFFKGIGKSIINFLITPINGGINLINGIKINVPNWVPIIGGKKWGFDLPKIPSFNTGVRNFSGGLAYVHKDELVELPGGSNVYTKNETRSIINNNRSNSTNGKVTNNYNINLNIKSLVNEIKDIENANQLLKIILNLAEASV